MAAALQPDNNLILIRFCLCCDAVPQGSLGCVTKAEVYCCRKHSVPLILCNYDGFYSGLIGLLKAFDTNGTLASSELKDVMLASSNEEARSCCCVFLTILS